MPTNLEFRQCPNCGKTIRSTASECYRCHSSVQPVAPWTKSVYGGDDPDDTTRTAHGALAYGGYEDDDDDFDYDEFIRREFNEEQKRKKSFRWYVTWLLLVTFSFPIVAAAVQLIFDR